MVTLFSALSGHLSFNGAPLAGAEVVQTAYNRRKKYTQHTITNEHGYFFFDKLTRRRTFIDYLPAEPLVSQEITLHVHGSKFLLWSFLKHSYDDDLSVECMHSNPTNASNFHFIGEVTGAEPYLQYLNFHSRVLGCFDLNFKHEALTQSVEQAYMNQLDDISQELSRLVSTEHAKNEANITLRHEFNRLVKAYENKQPMPENFKPHWLEYGYSEDIDIEIQDVQVVLNKRDCSFVFHCGPKENQKLSTTIEAKAIYTAVIAGKQESFQGPLMYHEALLTPHTLAFEGIRLYENRINWWLNLGT